LYPVVLKTVPKPGKA